MFIKCEEEGLRAMVRRWRSPKVPRKVVKGKTEDLHTYSLTYIRILYSFHYMTLISYNTNTLDTKNKKQKTHTHANTCLF